MLTIGEPAPDFTLADQNGEIRTLKDFAGKKLILYFYPKDNTAGCSKQAAGYAQLAAQFKEKGASVVGISKDSVASHQRFIEKLDLPFTLLSDPERQAIEAYGVWKEKKMCGKVSMGVVRSSFIIDENGILRGIYENVKAADNPAKMLALLDTLA